MTSRITEIIDIDLQELIPGFISNTELELKVVEGALVSNDMSTINRVGHNIKGSALNYGFVKLAEIGKGLERAGADNNAEMIASVLAQFREYLLTLEITFEDV